MMPIVWGAEHLSEFENFCTGHLSDNFGGHLSDGF